MLVIEQSVTEMLRSFKMSIMKDRRFDCASTSCLPYSTIISSSVRHCRMTCLAQVECDAATCDQSNSVCQLFAGTLNQNLTLEASPGVTTMIVISGTRTAAGKFRIRMLLLRKTWKSMKSSITSEREIYYTSSQTIGRTILHRFSSVRIDLAFAWVQWLNKNDYYSVVFIRSCTSGGIGWVRVTLSLQYCTALRYIYGTIWEFSI